MYSLQQNSSKKKQVKESLSHATADTTIYVNLQYDNAKVSLRQNWLDKSAYKTQDEQALILMKMSMNLPC